MRRDVLEYIYIHTQFCLLFFVVHIEVERHNMLAKKFCFDHVGERLGQGARTPTGDARAKNVLFLIILIPRPIWC